MADAKLNPCDAFKEGCCQLQAKVCAQSTCSLLRFLHIFYAFWAPKYALRAPKYALRITITELGTQENPILAKFSFILMSAMTRNRMIVIVSTVPD